MKLEENTLQTIIDNIASIDGPYYGGVVGYLNSINSLALLSKLIKRLANKKNSYENFYLEIGKKADKALCKAINLAENDGEVFRSLSQAPAKERGNNIKKVIKEQQEFQEDLRSLEKEISEISTQIKGSIKIDFDMISATFKSTRVNLDGIIAFELKKDISAS